MKRKRNRPFIMTMLLALLTGLFANLMAQNTSMVDLGKCNLKIVEIEYLKKVQTDKGMLKPASGKNRLVAVTLKGRVKDAGTFILTPDLYSVIYNYRRTMGLSRSVAIGSRGKSKSTGEYKEIWFSSEEVRLLAEYGANEDLELFILFDLPKEVEEFEVQIPAFAEKSS